MTMKEAPREGATPKRTLETRHVAPQELLLVARLRSGDSASHARLVKRYAPRMLAVARRLTRNEDDARDCLQDAFIQVFRGIDAFEHRASLATWLHRLVVKAALSRIRERDGRPEHSLEELMPRFDADGWRIEPETEAHSLAGQVLEDREMRRLVRRTINDLPARYRNLVLLRDVEGYSTQETAALLGFTPGAVRTGVHRARTALKSLLDSVLREKTF